MKNIMFIVVLLIGGFLCRANLPGPNLDSILASGNAGVASQAFLKTAQVMGLLRIEFNDLGLVRTAHVISGNTDLHLIGVPFLGWYKL